VEREPEDIEEVTPEQELKIEPEGKIEEKLLGKG
jgi:hypothetical protein